jgi:hypothetical protein
MGTGCLCTPRTGQPVFLSSPSCICGEAVDASRVVRVHSSISGARLRDDNNPACRGVRACECQTARLELDRDWELFFAFGLFLRIAPNMRKKSDATPRHPRAHILHRTQHRIPSPPIASHPIGHSRGSVCTNSALRLKSVCRNSESRAAAHAQVRRTAQKPAAKAATQCPTSTRQSSCCHVIAVSRLKKSVGPKKETDAFCILVSGGDGARDGDDRAYARRCVNLCSDRIHTPDSGDGYGGNAGDPDANSNGGRLAQWRKSMGPQF